MSTDRHGEPLATPADRLRAVLPHIREAMARAAAEYPAVLLGIIGKNPDGSGKLTADFEAAFLDDVEALLSAARVQP